MILDFPTSAELPSSADAVVVVGSGAAGLALARELGSRGRPVVLLESGGDVGDPPGDAEHLNEGSNRGLPFRLATHRARVLGGTTKLWHGQCMRLHEGDVQPRSWVDADGWPLGYAELSAYYPAAERWFGVSGRGYGPERWADYPDLERVDWDPAHLLHDFTEYTPTPLLGRRFRAELAGSASVSVVLHATASRLILGSAGGIEGVEILSGTGRRETLATRQAVLAAGAIENARLLQLSDPEGIGLGTGRAHTGHWLQDHPVVRTAQVLPRNWQFLQDRYTGLHKRGSKLFPKVRLAPAAQQSEGLLDAVGVFVHEHENSAVDALRRLASAARARQRPQSADLAQVARSLPPVGRAIWRRYVRGLSAGLEPSAVWLQVWLEQAPAYDSRVVLGSGLDALGLRQAEVHWKVGEQEMRTSRSFTRWIAEDLERLGLATVRELPAMADDEAWRGSVTDAYHPAGTTRMSARPEDGVVDPDLQVHGVPGLFVVGGSVFPTSGYANPTLTIVALALRLAEHLGAARVPAAA